MGYDPDLAERLDRLFAERPEVEVKKMFGGLCYMVAGHMCCGIAGERLMARVGPEQYQHCLALPQVEAMDFTGKPLRGFVYVLPEALVEDAELKAWVARCEAFVRTLAPKSPK